MRFPFILAAAACFISTASHAAILTYDFTGVIDSSLRYYLSPESSTFTEDGAFSDFSPGQIFSGSIAFETVSTSNYGSDPTFAVYGQKSSLQLTVQRTFGDFQRATTGLCDGVQYVIDNSMTSPSYDAVQISSSAFGLDCTTTQSSVSADYFQYDMGLFAQDVRPGGGDLPNMISSTDFVSDIGSLWGVAPNFTLYMNFFEQLADGSLNYASVSGKLTSFTARVPEPMSASLMFAGSLGLLWHRRRKQ
jgi:hypothetical protein